MSPEDPSEPPVDVFPFHRIWIHLGSVHWREQVLRPYQVTQFFLLLDQQWVDTVTPGNKHHYLESRPKVNQIRNKFDVSPPDLTLTHQTPLPFWPGINCIAQFENVWTGTDEDDSHPTCNNEGKRSFFGVCPSVWTRKSKPYLIHYIFKN